jgi:glutamate N-acetyltransferase/amino-acid N-acetyltransferase
MIMNTENFLPEGTVTSPKGFTAGAVRAGIKTNRTKPDLGMLCSEQPCTAAGMFTTSKIKASAVTLSEVTLKQARASAIVVNSGCANAYTGEQGIVDAKEMVSLAAAHSRRPEDEVLVASTGVTGQLLPMDRIRKGIGEITLSPDGGHDLAQAIMTTDTVPKEAAVSGMNGTAPYTIGGIAKGSWMIHPNMATMFCFLATDAPVEAGFLKSALKKAVDMSFNMISVDGDMSPSDTVVIMANGAAGGETIRAGSRSAREFRRKLNAVCVRLATALARDGEGATKLIISNVTGARNLKEARKVARAVVMSSLIKTAVHGGDPNWGRIVAAVAQSGIEVNLSDIDMAIGPVAVLKAGSPLPFDEKDVIGVLNQADVPVSIHLNMGKGSATAWGCDMSEEYVGINSEYMT